MYVHDYVRMYPRNVQNKIIGIFVRTKKQKAGSLREEDLPDGV